MSVPQSSSTDFHRPPNELLGGPLLPAPSEAPSVASVPPKRPQAPTPSRAAGSDTDTVPTSYNWFLGHQQRHYEPDPLDSPVSTYSDFSESSEEHLADLVMTPPQPKRREPVSLADIRAFGTWQIGVASFGSGLDSPIKLKEKMRRRSEQVLGRALAGDPVTSPAPTLSPKRKRATYSGLGLGIAEKVSFRTARSSIVHLGATVKTCSTGTWSESATSSPMHSTPTRSGGVARPLMRARPPRRAIPEFLVSA